MTTSILAHHPLIEVALRLKGSPADEIEARLLEAKYGADARPVQYGGEYFDWNCHISLLNRFLFISIPKSACTTILVTLHRAEALAMRSGSGPQRAEDVHDRDRSPLLRASQLPAGLLRQVLRSARFFRFCFVRNPFTRALSCYLDKVCRPGLQRQRVLARMGIENGASDRVIRFHEFLELLSEPDFLLMDGHWRPQWTTLLPSLLEFDFIGRNERFSEDFRFVCSRLNANAGRRLYVEPRMGREHSVQADAQLARHYDKSCLDRVRAIYFEDFVKFGYSQECGI